MTKEEFIQKAIISMVGNPKIYEGNSYQEAKIINSATYMAGTIASMGISFDDYSEAEYHMDIHDHLSDIKDILYDMNSASNKK